MKLAAIRIRGRVGIRKDIADTMNMLRLYRGNYCVILEETPANRGMLQKAKDFITWGDLDADVEKLLMEKRGEEYTELKSNNTKNSKDEKDKNKNDKKNNRFLMFGSKKIKPFFRLAPPRGGFERKGIKKQFTVGGVLGYRAKQINDLIKKMI